MLFLRSGFVISDIGVEKRWRDAYKVLFKDTQMTQTADPFLREQQMKIRAVLRKNAERKLQGKKKRGIKWIKAKQAQCAIIGHAMIAKKCVYCGTEE